MSAPNSGFQREIRRPKPWKQKRNKLSAVTIALVACVLGLLVMVAWMLMPDAEQQQAEAEEALKTQFQNECYADLKDQLRDPDSAHFESEYGVVIDSDDGMYTLLGEGRARNGFGGMNNFRIACTAYYDEQAETFDVESQIVD